MLKWLFYNVNERIYARDQTVFKEGDPSLQMFIVQSGEFVVYHDEITIQKGFK